MMPSSVTIDPAALAASISHWWSLAGVDVAVHDEPRNWLEREGAARGATSVAAPVAWVPPPPPAPVAAVELSRQAALPASAPMPDDLGAFMDWLANDPGQPEALFSRDRILPRIVPGAELLIVTDMPTAQDMTAGRLLSGPEHALIAAMLRAIGANLDQAHVASLLMARPAGGIMEDSLAEKAADRLRHFIGLAAPRTAIMLGDKTGRVLTETNGDDGPNSSWSINHQGGTISAMHLPAPFVLLKHPQRKAAAWGQLRELAVRR